MRQSNRVGVRSWRTRDSGSDASEVRAVIAVTIAVLCILVWLAIRPIGCPGSSRTWPQRRPEKPLVIRPIGCPGSEEKSLLVFVGLDVSGSLTAEERRFYYGPLCTAIDQILPANSVFTIWVYFASAEQVLEGPVNSCRELLRLLEWVLQRQPQVRGTRQAVMLREMLEKAKAMREHPIACILLTDGEDADPKSTEAVARQLAQLPNLKVVWVVPVEPDIPGEVREIRKALTALGERVVISTRLDVRQGLTRFAELIGK